MRRLRRDAQILGHFFSLRLGSVEAERPNVKRRYGVCYSDGSIRIRMLHVRTGQLLKYSSLVDTLCHELAHLRHFDHGQAFQVFYRRLLEYARQRGIYTPTPRWAVRPPDRMPAAPRPQSPQLELFASGAYATGAARRFGR